MSRRSNLLLNLAPDRRGLIADEAVHELTEMARLIRA